MTRRPLFGAVWGGRRTRGGAQHPRVYVGRLRWKPSPDGAGLIRAEPE